MARAGVEEDRQQLQVARHPRLALAQHAAQLQHRQFFPRQQRQDAQARRLGGRAQHSHRLIGGHRHEDIKISLYDYVKTGLWRG
jgi:hypothetical protein